MIGFESDEAVLHKLRERLRSMTDNELIQFGKTVRGLSAGPTKTSNPFKRQLLPLVLGREGFKPRRGTTMWRGLDRRSRHIPLRRGFLCSVIRRECRFLMCSSP
jgi:hypothetical protein